MHTIGELFMSETVKSPGIRHVNSMENDVHRVEIDPFVQRGQSFMSDGANSLTMKRVDTQQDRERRAGGYFLR